MCTSRPDIVFRRQHVAIFVDGDFWHGRNWPERRHRLVHAHNADYWVKKIYRNINRREANTERLAGDGWNVIRVWESVVKEDADITAQETETAIGRCVNMADHSTRDQRRLALS